MSQKKIGLKFSSSIILLLALLQTIHLCFAVSPETLEVGHKPWGIAVDEKTNRVYVVNWESGTVTIIDGTSDTIVKTVSIPHTPLYPIINENTDSIYVTGSQTGKTAILNMQDLDAIETLDLNLDFGVVSHLTNKFYAIKNGQYPNTGTILVVNSSTNQVLTEISEINQVEALAINEDGNILYAAKWGEAITNNKVAGYVYFIDGTTDRIISTKRIEGRVLALAFDGANDELFIRTTLPSQISVMDADTHEIIEAIPIGEGLTSRNGLVINEASHTVFTISDSQLYSINATDNALLGSTEVGGPWGVAVNPNSGKVYVSNSDLNSISIIEMNPSSNGDNFTTVKLTLLSYSTEIKFAQVIGSAVSGGIASMVLIRLWTRKHYSENKADGIMKREAIQKNPFHIVVAIFLFVLTSCGLIITGYIWYGFSSYSGPPPSGGGAIIEAFLYLLASMWFLVLSIPTVIGSILLLRRSRKGYYLSILVLSFWTLNLFWGIGIAMPRGREEYWYLLALPGTILFSAMYPFLVLSTRLIARNSALLEK